MLMSYYPIKNAEVLTEYMESYIPLICNVAKSFSIDLLSSEFQGDHLGLQGIKFRQIL